MQRGFDNLKISEQAAVIAQRHNEMFSQGKRNDIIRELQILDGKTDETFDAMRQKSDSRKDTAESLASDYGLCRTSVVQLIRIDKLTDELKALIDKGKKDTAKGNSVKISDDTYSRYFEPAAKPKEIAETIEKALDFYFENHT